MTADRPSVRIVARWLARVDGVSSMLRLAMLALTGVSTMTVALKEYGFGGYVWHIITLMGFAMIAFAYFYTEGGVWNQVRRDKSDMSKNYSTPFQKISNEMTARAFYAGFQGRELEDCEREAIKEEIDSAFEELRDGVELED